MSIFQQAVLGVLERFERGRLTLQLPDGSTHAFGQGNGVEASLRVNDARFFSRILMYGDIGFGEAYTERWWESNCVTSVISWLIDNRDFIPNGAGSRVSSLAFNGLSVVNRLIHTLNDNTKQQSRKNIEAHYDLGNDLYALFLDPSMTYSSAFFQTVDQSLEDAQREKYRRLCDKLRLSPGDHVLEVGCGWGGFGCFAAKEFGCRVTGVTISPSQLEIANERVKAEGLEDRVSFELRDYRDLDGRFDKIVSIEMLEAVGHRFLKTFFHKAHSLLKRDGALALQVITFPEDGYETYKRDTDWIQKHIFPGGHLPSIRAILDAVSKSGDLCLQHLDSFGQHYAKTLRLWRDRFQENEAEVRALGYDDDFIRKWTYYLCYCEAAFSMRNINVTQLLFARPVTSFEVEPVWG